MKIEIRYLPSVYDEYETPINNVGILKQLNGIVADADLSQYLDSSFEDISFCGGSIRLAFEGENLYSIVSYFSERKLTGCELDRLKLETNGQLLDGYGETPLELLVSGQKICIEFADSLSKDLPYSILEVDEGSRPKKARRSPIFKAIENGDLEKARKYLTPEHLFSAEKWGATPLMAAIREGHSDLAIEMINVGANVKHRSKDTGSTPLSMGASAGDIEVCKLLLELGADVNSAQEDPDGILTGFTPLLWAANRSTSQLVELLIKAGANVNQVNISGQTALMIAKDSSIKNILIKYGASI